jgi:3-oxoisoapionate kinase
VSAKPRRKVGRASRLPSRAKQGNEFKARVGSPRWAGETPALLLSFYGDDFTGSTDALEQLTLAGIRTALFIEPPTARQIARFKNLQAVGVAGMTRSLAPDEMERELRPALQKLKALGARHVHYKVCSTFDSSPAIGSIGRVIDVAANIFRAPFVPLLVAAPALGRYCVFGNLFARFGIGSDGAIHRLDRHPSISKHPITPMTEADLRLHLAKQTRKRIGLFDILKVALPPKEARAALKKILADGAEIVLIDALYAEQLERVGELIDGYASRKRPLFSVGSSGIEMALGAYWATHQRLRSRGRQSAQNSCSVIVRRLTSAATVQLLVASGSCSPVTAGQIKWALANGFAEVALDTAALAAGNSPELVLRRATAAAVKHLRAGRSVIVHTSKRNPDARFAASVKGRSAHLFGTALGRVMRNAIEQTKVRRLCIAGGDTSSYAARALGIEALEMIAPLTPGAPLCRAHAPTSPADGLEVVFKGGQVGAKNYFGIVTKGTVEK